MTDALVRAQLSLSKLNSCLFNVWIKNWNDWFIDDSGGFFERLNQDTSPMDIEYKRLVTQCRQIYVNSYAYNNTKSEHFLLAAKHGFDFIVDNYLDKYGWYFSVTPNGKPFDTHLDLYAHAFVILCLSQYYLATHEKSALILSKQTLEFIKSHFKTEIGFYEALDNNLQPIARIRRQNPHMHLLEACLSMYEVAEDVAYLQLSDYLITLFEKFFYQEGKLLEFFNDNLDTHPEKGHILEPGHHFEWTWLLHKRISLAPSTKNMQGLKQYIKQLFLRGREDGIDTKFGGIYNEVGCDGDIINPNKRIWVITEAIRAHCVYYANYKNIETIESLENILTTFKQKYISTNGNWVEICNEDLSPQTNYMPGTTTYHIFINILESKALLDKMVELKEVEI